MRLSSSLLLLALSLMAACVGTDPAPLAPSSSNTPADATDGGQTLTDASGSNAEAGADHGDAEVPRWTVPADVPASTGYTVGNTADGAIVTDNLTGLTWQDRTESTSRSWDDASAYCGDLTYGNASDWRLPTRLEVISVLTFDPNASKAPTFAPVFSSVNGPECFWTSTVHLYAPASHWIVDVLVGAVEGTSVKKCATRCVRGAPVAGGSRFERLGTEFVRDRLTGLSWERTTSERSSRGAAERRCKDLVVDGQAMRLPGVKELASIVDDTRSSPASFSEFDTVRENTFTANPFWLLNFVFGDLKQTSGEARSRCVSGP